MRVPTGTAAVYAANIDKARAADKVDTVLLRFGETLDDVARARGVAVRELRRLNGVKDSAELRAGTAIVVPQAGGGGKAQGRGKDDDDDGATPRASRRWPSDDDTVLVAVPDRSFSYEGRERVFYRTRDGDSLDEIADAFGVRGDELIEWNNVDPGAKLHPRMVLQIFVRKDFDPAGVMLLDPDQGAGRDAGLGGVPGARDGAPREEAPLLHGEGGRHAGQAGAPLRADAGRSRAHQPVLVQHRAARGRSHRRLLADGRRAPRAHDGDDARQEAPRARRAPPRAHAAGRGREEEAGDRASPRPTRSRPPADKPSDKSGKPTRPGQGRATRPPTRAGGKKK